jgi:hypothetical protein
VTGGVATLEAAEPRLGTAPSVPPDRSRRRFIIAVTTAMAVVSIPYLWVLWDMWSGSLNPLRGVSFDNLYDLQARAIFHGHLWVPKGSISLEAFVHNGHDYTYFGLFPSLIRMPVLLMTSSLDKKLTAPSLLLAWICAGFVSALLLWRLRILIRGAVALGRAEAVSYGLLMATITGGSVLVYLAATPFVYGEDFAWSVTLTLGSVFAFLGVLERPSRGRVLAAGLLVLAANLNRSPTGYACVIGALLVAGWFALGKGGRSNRRFAVPMAAVGLIPLAVSCAVTWAKFGLPFGLPMAEQAWAKVNAHRRYFLAANGGKAFSVAFMPSTLTAYLQPGGISFSSAFPFIQLPTAPARTVGSAVLDQTYRSGSIPATMPLLLLLSCWGAVTAFRRRMVGQVRLTRIPMLTAAGCVVGVLVWGYIADRYMSDFMPLLVLASGIGLVDIWRRVDQRRPASRRRGVGRLVLSIVAVLTLFGVVANFAVSITPTEQWNSDQTNRFVTLQRSITPSGQRTLVHHGNVLPYWAPANELFAMNDCSGLYVSTGDRYDHVPGQQIQHATWIPVEQEKGINHQIRFSFTQPNNFTSTVPLLRYGDTTLVVMPAGRGRAILRLLNAPAANITWPPTHGWAFSIEPGGYYEVTVMTDPNLHSMIVTWYASTMIDRYIGHKEVAVVQTTKAAPGEPPPQVTIADVTNTSASGTANTAFTSMKLCRHLLRGN